MRMRGSGLLQGLPAVVIQRKHWWIPVQRTFSWLATFLRFGNEHIQQSGCCSSQHKASSRSIVTKIVSWTILRFLKGKPSTQHVKRVLGLQ